MGLDDVASNLVTGTYLASISFTNLAAGSVQNRPFALLVGQPLLVNGGFETGDFTGWTLTGDGGYDDLVDSGSFVTYIAPHSGKYFAALGEVGYLASLSQTVPTVAGQSYLLSLWLNSPNVSDYTPNEFSVSWNGSPLFDQANISPTTNSPAGWTNLQFIVAATNAASTLQIGGRDDNYYLGLDDVSVQPIQALTLQPSLAASCPGMAFSWNALTDGVYEVRFSTNLLQTNWTFLTDITATHSPMVFTDTNSTDGSPQKFYQLLLLP